MKQTYKPFAFGVIILATLLSGCSSGSGDKSVRKLESLESERGEGKEDGTQYGKSDVYDAMKHGTHLILKYDLESNSFIGTVENTSEKLIHRVRVEVHLSNGTELRPIF